MLTLPASVRIYVAAEPVDLRRGFDGLAATVRSVMPVNPMLCVGHEYVAGTGHSMISRAEQRTARSLAAT